MAKKSRSTRKKSSKKTTKKAAKKKTAKKSKKKAAKKKKKAAKKKTTKKKSAKKKSAKKKTARKKATKKKATKSRKTSRKPKSKAATMRTTSRERVYQLTREVPDHHYFILANGKPVKHVAELASVLDQLEDHIFHHHVSPDRNDFHNWVKDVFDDLELARKILGISDKKRLQLVIYKHMAGHED